MAELSWRCRRGGTGRGAGAWPCRDWPIRCLSRGGAIASKPGRGSGVCVACRGGTLFRARPEGRRAERRAGRAGGADLPAGRVMQGMMDGRKEVEKRAGSCVPDAGKTSRASGPLRHAGSNGTEAEPPLEAMPGLREAGDPACELCRQACAWALLVENAGVLLPPWETVCLQHRSLLTAKLQRRLGEGSADAGMPAQSMPAGGMLSSIAKAWFGGQCLHGEVVACARPACLLGAKSKKLCNFEKLYVTNEKY